VAYHEKNKAPLSAARRSAIAKRVRYVTWRKALKGGGAGKSIGTEEKIPLKDVATRRELDSKKPGRETKRGGTQGGGPKKGKRRPHYLGEPGLWVKEK